MMEDLAMHLIEILMNSIHAGATKIFVTIFSSTKNDEIQIIVEDNGKGMDKEKAESVSDPFVTSRETRKIGMGLAFLKGLSEMCNGSYKLESGVGIGTVVEAKVQKSHIDVPPLGNLGEMSMAVIQANPDIDYKLQYKSDNDEFLFDTEIVKRELDGISLIEPDILLWIKDYINQGIAQIEEETV